MAEKEDLIQAVEMSSDSYSAKAEQEMKVSHESLLLPRVPKTKIQDKS